MSLDASLKPSFEELTKPYLTALRVGLIGRVPVDVEQAFLSETEFWIERQTYDFFVQGSELEDAVKLAIARHGSPRTLAITLSEEWFESGVDSPLLRKVGRGNAIAGTIFGFGNLVSIVLLQLALFFPSDRANLPFSPAVVRSVVPESMPLPGLDWQFLIPAAAVFLLPVILGMIVGTQIPVRASSAVYRAMCPVVLSAFSLGCLLLPNTTGLLFALIQTVFWLPAGCLAAHLTSTFARHRRAKTKRSGSAAGPRTPGSKPIGAT